MEEFESVLDMGAETDCMHILQVLSAEAYCAPSASASRPAAAGAAAILCVPPGCRGATICTLPSPNQLLKILLLEVPPLIHHLQPSVSFASAPEKRSLIVMHSLVNPLATPRQIVFTADRPVKLQRLLPKQGVQVSCHDQHEMRHVNAAPHLGKAANRQQSK